MIFTFQFLGGKLSVMLIVVEMESVTRVQILDKTDYISVRANACDKGINPSVPADISKL